MTIVRALEDLLVGGQRIVLRAGMADTGRIALYLDNLDTPIGYKTGATAEDALTRLIVHTWHRKDPVALPHDALERYFTAHPNGQITLEPNAHEYRMTFADDESRSRMLCATTGAQLYARLANIPSSYLAAGTPRAPALTV